MEELAGGKVSLAHPYQMGLPDGELETLVGAAQGLGAGCHRVLAAQVQPVTAGILPPSGGKVPAPSDRRQHFHGERVKPDVELAALELNLDWLLS